VNVARGWAELPDHRGLERRELAAALDPALERDQRFALVTRVGLGVAGQQRRDHDADHPCRARHGTTL
jgi:hypothetical protein